MQKKKRKLNEEVEAWEVQRGPKAKQRASKPQVDKPQVGATSFSVGAMEEEEESQTYVVQAGDNLSKIAKALLGDASRWKEIFEANKDTLKDPNMISVGQTLNIPPK